jgi:transcriptional regulator with XRE-family HTH domain
MVSLITPSKAQNKLAENVRQRRLNMDLTQEGLSKRSGVPLPTLRKFEQKGAVSLESYLKILMVVGGLEKMLDALTIEQQSFSSIDDVLEDDNKPTKQRGSRT